MQKVNEGSRNSSRKSCFYFSPGESSHLKKKKKKKLLLTGNRESCEDEWPSETIL